MLKKSELFFEDMKYIFGNWKMYLDVKESMELTHGLSALTEFPEGYEIGVFPTALAFAQVRWLLQEKKSPIVVGAQNVAWTPKGAYTGAVSAVLFKEAGARYALVGHSERRHIFGENDAAVRKKLEACADAGLTPILCIGETRQDKEEEKRMYRLKKQIKAAFEGSLVATGPCMVAYEPVWAVGTGNPCLPTDAEDVIGWIKLELKEYSQADIPVLYGGSVTPDNAASYLTGQTIDGILVGSASAKLESFKALIAELSAK